LSRQIFARNLQGSNTIEGYNVTKDDAVAAIANDQPMDADAETWMAVTGYRDAMTYVLQLADDPTFSCGPELVKSLHFIMLRYDLDKHPGRWRPGLVYVRNEREEIVYDPPQVELVPTLMNEFVTWLNAPAPEEPSIVRAAMGHLNFTLIHPFSDGNGRMARCLQTLILARHGILGPEFCSIEEYLGRNRQAYYQALTDVAQGKWSPHRSPVPFVKFCLTAHYRQAHTLLRRVRITEKIWEELDVVTRARKLPERMIYALHDAAFGYRVTNPRYRKLAEISENLASRDLTSLVEQELLIPKGERRGRFYIRGTFLANLWQKVQETRTPIPDPFEEQSKPSSSGQQHLFQQSPSGASRKAS
jgi:Fic family protein